MHISSCVDRYRVGVRHRARRAAVLVVFLGSLCCAGVASAHNGVGAAFTGRAGPYTVYAYDAYPNPNGALAYRLVVIVTRSGEPADVSRVAVTAASLAEVGASPSTTVVPASVQVYANVAFYELRNPYPHFWRVTVRVSGSTGAGVVSFPMHGTAPVAAPPSYSVAGDGGGGSWLVVAGVVAGVVVVVAGVITVAMRRRRRAT